jgi:hypothetical protein
MKFNPVIWDILKKSDLVNLCLNNPILPNSQQKIPTS